MSKQFSAACERNQESILAILRDTFARCRTVLEIGSGTGQHAVFFGRHLSHLTWQTSDLASNHASIMAWQSEADLPNVLSPIDLNTSSASSWPKQKFDAVFSANTSHIMAWPEVQAMFAGAARILNDQGLLCIYGPFNYSGRFTSESNARFDASLKAHAPHMGIRGFEAMDALATECGFVLQADHEMPANNRLLVWSKER
jgi:cyclopropane fatty-acyl-phospholipid synthase-like methyltransferase